MSSRREGGQRCWIRDADHELCVQITFDVVAGCNLRLGIWALIVLRVRNVDNRKLTCITWRDVRSEIFDELVDVGALVCLVQVVAEADLVCLGGLRFVAVGSIQPTQAIDGGKTDVAIFVLIQ